MVLVHSFEQPAIDVITVHSLAKWYGVPVISKYAALKWEYYGIVLTVYPAENWAPRVHAHELFIRPSACLSIRVVGNLGK